MQTKPRYLLCIGYILLEPLNSKLISEQPFWRHFVRKSERKLSIPGSRCFFISSGIVPLKITYPTLGGFAFLICDIFCANAVFQDGHPYPNFGHEPLAHNELVMMYPMKMSILSNICYVAPAVYATIWRASVFKHVSGNIAGTLRGCANRVDRNLLPNRDWTDPIGNRTTSSARRCPAGTPLKDCANRRTAGNQQKSKCDSRRPAKIDLIPFQHRVESVVKRIGIMTIIVKGLKLLRRSW
jgi:hypothetical protein